jgi:hypothetical protein
VSAQSPKLPGAQPACCIPLKKVSSDCRSWWCRLTLQIGKLRFKGEGKRMPGTDWHNPGTVQGFHTFVSLNPHKSLQGMCGRLSNAHPTRCSHPNSWSYDYIYLEQQKGLCTYDVVSGLEEGDYSALCEWYSCNHKGHRERKQCEDRCTERDWLLV